MRWPSPHRGQPADPAAVHDDDLLLTAIGQGMPAPAGEPMVDLLSAWRAEIVRTAARSLACNPRPAARQGTARRALRQLVLAAAAVVVTAGLATATFNATPESPLWPVTTAFFPEQASVRLAREAIHDARQAAAEGRYDDSQRHLEEAARLVDRLGSDPRIEQLRSEIDALRTAIPGAEPPVPGVAPPAAGTEPPVPAPSGTARPGPAPATRAPASPAPAPASPAPAPASPAPPADLLPSGPALISPAPAVPAAPGLTSGPRLIPRPGTASASPPGAAAPPDKPAGPGTAPDRTRRPLPTRPPGPTRVGNEQLRLGAAVGTFAPERESRADGRHCV